MRVASAMVLVAGCAVCANGQPVSALDLEIGTTGPFITMGDDTTAASDVAWFTFELSSITDVDIDINRAAAEFDLAAVLFSGDVDGVDATAISPDGLANGFLFDTIGAVYGPLTNLGTEDDTEDDDLGGPFGDPRFTDTLGVGVYSIMIVALSPEDTPSSFTITSNVGVPAPSALGALGLGGLIMGRRRR